VKAARLESIVTEGSPEASSELESFVVAFSLPAGAEVTVQPFTEAFL